MASCVEASRESRLRSQARSRGYLIRKSRTRHPDASDFGCYFIVEGNTNFVVAGTFATGRPEFTLDDVEIWLREDDEFRERLDG